MTYYISRDAVLNQLAADAAYNIKIIEEADGPEASRERRHAHSKLTQINRTIRIVSDMPMHAADDAVVEPAPPKSEWEDRAFLAVALSDSKPGARAAVTRLLADMKMSVAALHLQFKEQHERKLAIKARADG
jgi:hypothetical protein